MSCGRAVTKLPGGYPLLPGGNPLLPGGYPLLPGGNPLLPCRLLRDGVAPGMTCCWVPPRYAAAAAVAAAAAGVSRAEPVHESMTAGVSSASLVGRGPLKKARGPEDGRAKHEALTLSNCPSGPPPMLLLQWDPHSIPLRALLPPGWPEPRLLLPCGSCRPAQLSSVEE